MIIDRGGSFAAAETLRVARLFGYALALWTGCGVAAAAPPSFGNQWSCVAAPDDIRSCSNAECRALTAAPSVIAREVFQAQAGGTTRTSEATFTIDWKRKRAYIWEWGGKVKIIESRDDERQVHGLLRNFVTFDYFYARATLREGKPRAFFYFGDHSLPELWMFGFADCKVSQ